MDSTLFFNYNNKLPTQNSFNQPEFDALSFMSKECGHSFLKDNRDHLKKLVDSYPSRAGVQRDSSYNINFPSALALYDDYHTPLEIANKPVACTNYSSRGHKTSGFEGFLDFNTGLKKNKLFADDFEGSDTKYKQFDEKFPFNEAVANQFVNFNEQHNSLSQMKKKISKPQENQVFASMEENQGKNFVNKANAQFPHNNLPIFVGSKDKERQLVSTKQSLGNQTQINTCQTIDPNIGKEKFKPKKGYQKAFTQEIPLNNIHMQAPIPKPKGEKEAKADLLIESIEKYEINPISLLNEINGKLKKKADYQMKESCSGRTKTFECTCSLNDQPIGLKKGSSKQIAKAEAAKDGIYTILTKEQYVTESAVIILSIQKASEKNSHSDKKQNFNKSLPETNLEDPSTASSVVSLKKSRVSIANEEEPKTENENLNQTEIFSELNTLAKKFAIEPIWSFPHQTIDGDFEVELKLGDLEVKEKRKKKQEAKREAATKMLAKIKELQKEEANLIESLNELPTTKKTKEDRTMKLFNKSLKPFLHEKIPHLEVVTLETIHDNNKEFENHIISLLNRYHTGLILNECLEGFFKKITDYTSMTTSNPKQVMLLAEKHLADFIKDCYLIPVGSFALKCMRNNNLTIDTILSFQEVKSISKKDLLELYCFSLETCYYLDQQSGTNIIDMRFSFKIIQDFIEVTAISKNQGNFRIRIFFSNVSQDSKLNNSISESNQHKIQVSHIQRIYSCFQQSYEELSEVRRLLNVVRLWRRNAKLEFIRPEIIDIVLIDIYLKNPTCKISEIVIKLFTLLSSRELTEALLIKFGESYQSLYQELDYETKEKLMNTSQQTLKNIHQKKFSEAHFL